MSSRTTTRVGWVTWSIFCNGLSSGPGAVLDLILEVGEEWWMRLRGSRHKCSGSGGLEEEREDEWAQLRPAHSLSMSYSPGF